MLGEGSLGAAGVRAVLAVLAAVVMENFPSETMHNRRACECVPVPVCLCSCDLWNDKHSGVSVAVKVNISDVSSQAAPLTFKHFVSRASVCYRLFMPSLHHRTPALVAAPLHQNVALF